MARNFATIARQYATEVVSGGIPACKWVRLACQRHLDDLEKSKDKAYPYVFDEKKAARICAFIEKLPHVKGRWAARNQKIKLEPWQIFILSCLFGWVERETGHRRFRKAYICVPRKNGKSPIAAGIGDYMLAADGEYGAEVYCGATTEQQAHEVFRPAKMMVERTPEMAEALGITVNAKSLVIESNGSRFLPVVGRPGDGASPSCGICDEFHEANHADLLDTLFTGMVGREQPLLLVITTAGTNLASPCYDLQLQVQKVLEGTLEDDQQFGIIYTIDAEDDWTSEAALYKANPNLGVSIDLKTLQANQKQAVQNAAKQNLFKTKHLNVWCNASVAWLNMEAWKNDADAVIDEFAGQECFIGLDVATKLDLTAAVRLFRKVINGETHYFVFPKFYLPEGRVNQPDAQHYQKWAAEGHLIAMDGVTLDNRLIADDLIADTKTYAVKELCFDQWEADYVTQEFAQQTGVPIVKIPQSPQYLSDPAKQLEAMVLSGRLHHDNNPVMTWCCSNVVAKYNSHDNLELGKERNENKIDGVDALLNALYRALATPVAAPLQRYQRIHLF